jgi:Transposase DDE domain group 1
MTDANPFLPGLSPVSGKPLTAAMDAGNLSSNGGLIVLREIAVKLGLADVLTRPLPDARNPLLVTHSYAHMATARMMAIAAGYEDCDDLDALRHDPALKIACDRAPETGAGIASQPTLSRLENLASWRQLARIGLGMIDVFAKSFAASPREIILDIDDTDDLVHGGQQLALFNTHAGGHCFQPILIFDGITGKPVAALLRPGKRPSGAEAAKVLRHVIGRIRRHWPKVGILVRGDSHYCSGPVLNLLVAERCDFMLGLAVNPVLKPIAAPWKSQCKLRHQRSCRTVRRFHQFKYAAGSWAREHKVIARVEATDMGTDVRFVVTNLSGRGRHLYENVYCARGNAENLIKDMKLYTRSDKTACHRWEANQFRLFLHMGAYWLLHTLRRTAPAKSPWRGATFETIRARFVKVAVRVEELKTRIKLSFPTSWPDADVLSAITASLTAQVPARGS